MIRPKHLRQILRDWSDGTDGSADKSKELVLMLLAHAADPFSRRHYSPGHITGTACVLHPSRQSFLLVHHRRLDRWLFPGGHVEAEDSSIYETARREATEETGVLLAGDAPRIVGIDVHGIPARGKEPYHLHHDIIVAFRAKSDSLIASIEAREVKWCSIDEMNRYGLSGSIHRAFHRALGNRGGQS